MENSVEKVKIDWFKSFFWWVCCIFCITQEAEYIFVWRVTSVFSCDLKDVTTLFAFFRFEVELACDIKT